MPNAVSYSAAISACEKGIGVLYSGFRDAVPPHHSTLTWGQAAPRVRPCRSCTQQSLSPFAHDSATPAELITPGLRPGGCCPSGWAPAAPFARPPSHFGAGRIIKTSPSLPAASDERLVVSSVLGGSPSLHNSPQGPGSIKRQCMTACSHSFEDYAHIGGF